MYFFDLFWSTGSIFFQIKVCKGCVLSVLFSKKGKKKWQTTKKQTNERRSSIFPDRKLIVFANAFSLFCRRSSRKKKDQFSKCSLIEIGSATFRWLLIQNCLSTNWCQLAVGRKRKYNTISFVHSPWNCAKQGQITEKTIEMVDSGSLRQKMIKNEIKCRLRPQN